MSEGLLPVLGQVPERPLCQQPRGGCAACCGLYNFQDRSPAAEHARLTRRTEAVSALLAPGEPPPLEELAAVRDELLDEEEPDYVSDVIKVCPFAGYLDGVPDEPARGRVGCLIHPARMPDGSDPRDLAVYPREVCEGHFCAPHDWLRPVEVALAQTASGTLYGRVVTDAGLVKAVRALLEGALNRPLRETDCEAAADALDALFAELLTSWAWADPDPRRFGGVLISETDLVERTLPGMRELLPDQPRAVTAVLDAAATTAGSPDQALEAVDRLRALIDRASRAIVDRG